MLSNFTVTSTADTTATGTLRWAITQSDNTTGPNVIDFAITAAGAHTINLGSALPTITKPVTIDGTTQSGYTSSPVLAPVIVLNGSGAGTSTVGLNLTASAAGSTVKGLVIQDFSGSGVLINGGSADTISDDLIGLTAAGTAAASDGGDGVTIEGNATKNTISADVISGNIGSGIDITGSDTTGNVVTGNLIGTNVQGTHAVPNNGVAGVFISAGASHNTVGGTTAATRNIISANNGYGVYIYETSGNVVEGDYIGTDVSGTLALGNNEYGDGGFIYGSTGNTIASNDIGTGLSGSLYLGNYGFGVSLNNVSGNTVETNNIDNNGTYGVYLYVRGSEHAHRH